MVMEAVRERGREMNDFDWLMLVQLIAQKILIVSCNDWISFQYRTINIINII